MASFEQIEKLSALVDSEPDFITGVENDLELDGQLSGQVRQLAERLSDKTQADFLFQVAESLDDGHQDWLELQLQIKELRK